MQLWMHQPIQMLSGSPLDHLISGLHDVGCQRASRKRRVKPEHFFLRATSMIYEALADFLQGLRLDLSPSNRKVIDKLDFRESVPYGSHIAVPGQLGPWHHGILIDSQEVIHMYGDSKPAARVRSCSLKDFTAGTDRIAVVLYEGDSDAHRRDTRLAAKWMLRVFGNAAEPLYNIMGFNCEHFAVGKDSGSATAPSQWARKQAEPVPRCPSDTFTKC